MSPLCDTLRVKRKCWREYTNTFNSSHCCRWFEQTQRVTRCRRCCDVGLVMCLFRGAPYPISLRRRKWYSARCQLIQHGCGQGWASATFNTRVGSRAGCRCSSVTSVTNLDSSVITSEKYFLWSEGDEVNAKLLSLPIFFVVKSEA